MRATTILLTTALAFAGVAVARAANDGYLYGTVETDSGNTYRGFLRWGTEESFWDDHFNSVKEPNEYARRRPQRDRDRERIEIFGITIGYYTDRGTTHHVLTVRYGDIAEIEPRGGDRARMKLTNGETLELDGGSNDLGATIHVRDASLGEVELRWRDIRRIVFSPAPADAEPPAARLYGTLTTREQTYTGFIQWDLQECLATDILDGESEDGDVDIEMGKIKAIEKRNRRGSWVELWDGRRLLLEDTNDVDDSIDGIFVEDERFGRVEVGWDAFVRVDFEKTADSGRAYGDYEAIRPLTGKVTDVDGRTHRGRIVFDLDEEYTWELLHGNLGPDVEYHIPFERVRSVRPVSRDASVVVLKNGLELELEDSQDVSDSNDGILVIAADGGETYVGWDDVEILELD